MAISGIQLRTALRATGEKMRDIRLKSGLKETTFFWLFRQKDVSDNYIEMFEKLGYEVNKPMDYATLQKLVKTLEEALAIERAHNNLLKQQIELLSSLITKGIEHDYVFFNAVAAKIKKLPWIK